MKIITLNKDNIQEEHICCAISDKKCLEGYKLKKDWLKNQFDEGYVFKKLDVKHKVFIEYMPAENAWAPLDAPGYTFINCFWVAGSYKGQGYGRKLLEECFEDSKDKNGVVVISSSKKRPYMSDKKFFVKHGFEVCDTAPPFYELLVKRFNNESLPSFRENAKVGGYANEQGLKIIYSNQCPYTEYYVNEIMQAANEYGVPFTKVKLEKSVDAQNLPTVSSLYSLFYNGKFITNEILTRSKFEKLWSQLENGEC